MQQLARDPSVIFISILPVLKIYSRQAMSYALTQYLERSGVESWYGNNPSPTEIWDWTRETGFYTPAG